MSVSGKYTKVKIPVPKSNRNKAVTFKIPDMRSDLQVLQEIELQSPSHKWELRISSRGNLVATISASLLAYYNNKLPLTSISTVLFQYQGELTLQLKPLQEQEACQLILMYTSNTGLPLYHSEFPLSQPSDRENLTDALVKEIRKMEPVEVKFLFPKHDVDRLTLTDPYTVEEVPSELTPIHTRKGEFSLRLTSASPLFLDNLSRMTVKTFNSDNNEIYPSDVGVVLFGFP